MHKLLTIAPTNSENVSSHVWQTSVKSVFHPRFSSEGKHFGTLLVQFIEPKCCCFINIFLYALYACWHTFVIFWIMMPFNFWTKSSCSLCNFDSRKVPRVHKWSIFKFAHMILLKSVNYVSQTETIYPPKIDMNSNQIKVADACVPKNHDSGGVRTPTKLLPI